MAKSYAIGKRFGFFIASIIFFSIMFFILSYLGKLPEAAKYIHFLVIAIFVFVIKAGASK